MKIRMNHILIVLLFLILMYALNIKNDNNVLRYKNENVVDLLEWYQPRVKAYIQITLKQDSIIQANSYTRRLKSEDKELLELIQCRIAMNIRY